MELYHISDKIKEVIMPKEQETPLCQICKFFIPACMAFPLSITLLKDQKSGNCVAVTEDGECEYAYRRHHLQHVFECKKNTQIRLDAPQPV